MAPRSSWKGFLKLSLVSVPVKAYTAAVSSAEIRLNQLHDDCHARIRYQKTCPEHGEVTNDKIVSGYEFAKGQYVVIDLEELAKLRSKSDHSVQIDGFIAPDALDPIYHSGKTYYLVPDGAVGQKPYALLHHAMTEQRVNALAKIVLSGREQVVIVRPVDGLLLMTVLSHDAKVRKPEEVRDDLVEQELSEAEVALTKTLIDASVLSDFKFSRYRDEYVDKLTKVIQAKVDGQELVQVPDHEEPKILNLMEALKRSVAEAQLGSAEEPVAAPRKQAASASRKKTTRKKKSG
ncbi:MAG: Ku protein [Planctomycetota bacterium]